MYVIGLDGGWGGRRAQATDPGPRSRVPESRGPGRYGTGPGPISDQFVEVGEEGLRVRAGRVRVGG